MRKNKFRVWNKKTKIMVDLAKITPPALSIEVGIYIPDHPDLIILQYTGKKDKEDKDIYEGDIVSGIYNGTIVFCHPCASFGLSTDGTGEIDTMYWFDNDFGSDKIKIIGNIFETPEWVKKKGLI